MLVPSALAAMLLSAPAAAADGPALLRALAETPAGGPRVAAATRALIGIRYRTSPLGEGAGTDPDPRFRLDAFDCMTFVETAIALGSSRSLTEAARALDELRYADEPPSFGARLHEVQAQWIPLNVARGWIVELSRGLAGDRALPLVREHTAERWDAVRRAGHGIAGLPREREPIGRFETWVVPPDQLEAVAPRIPDGAVIVVFRTDERRLPTRVAHMGLVVEGRPGERLVRHASSAPGAGRVIDEPLGRFVAREARAYPRWPLSGFALYAVPDSTARVAALASQAE